MDKDIKEEFRKLNDKMDKGFECIEDTFGVMLKEQTKILSRKTEDEVGKVRGFVNGLEKKYHHWNTEQDKRLDKIEKKTG